MKIYIDTECKCHTTNQNGEYREFNLDFFDGKCEAFIEGYRYCPSGESYIRDDGKVFYGECIVPWKNFLDLNTAQREYEQELLEQYKKEIAELDAVLLEMQYQNLVEGL